MTNVLKVAVVIDPWKLEIFSRILKESGYAFSNAGRLSEDSILLRVSTTNTQALRIVIQKAQAECKQTGRPA